MKNNKLKRVLSIIPLLLLIAVAVFLWEGNSNNKGSVTDTNSTSMKEENNPQITGNKSGNNEPMSNEDDEIPTGWRVKPTMTYSPDTKVYLSGEEYGVTNEQYKYMSSWAQKEKKYIGNMDEDECVNKENVYSVGEEVPILDKKVSLTVNSVEVYDTIAGIDKYYFGNGDKVNVDMILENGKIDKVSRFKMYKYADGSIEEEEKETSIKLVVLDCEFTCDANWVERLPVNMFRMVPLIESDGKLVTQYSNEAVNMGIEEVYTNYSGTPYGMDEPCMFDKPIAKMPSSFFQTYITKDEVIECKIGYFVDVDYLENMYVYYKGMANSIYTDSCLQKFIKLF